MNRDSAVVQSPETLIVVLVLGAIIGMAIERFRSKLRRQAWREKNNWRPRYNRGHRQRDMQPQAPAPDAALPKAVDAADQLRIVMGADFEPQAILNKSEARVFKELDLMVIGRNPGWQVMAQVSLGEILYCNDPKAYSCVNSKRVDLLLMDEDCQPRHAIEYQGGAHNQGTAAARDAIKKEALRRAGIGYHEVIGGQTTPSELKRLVERLVPSTDQPQDIIAQLSGQGG
ncbi:MAG: DUF2726 domain-containing protein [Oricola sp.]|nr:DUF2726 domain-containing protein [Oricola sp.]MCI5074004.1 DUF2726 domain-containing protein [Oricola sp.]